MQSKVLNLPSVLSLSKDTYPATFLAQQLYQAASGAESCVLGHPPLTGSTALGPGQLRQQSLAG